MNSEVTFSYNWAHMICISMRFMSVLPLSSSASSLQKRINIAFVMSGIYIHIDLFTLRQMFTLYHLTRNLTSRKRTLTSRKITLIPRIKV